LGLGEEGKRQPHTGRKKGGVAVPCVAGEEAGPGGSIGKRWHGQNEAMGSEGAALGCVKKKEERRTLPSRRKVAGRRK